MASVPMVAAATGADVTRYEGIRQTIPKSGIASLRSDGFDRL